MIQHRIIFCVRSYLALSAGSLAMAIMASSASAAVLISDNFTVPSNSNDPNFSLNTARQSGPLFPFSYNVLGDNHQVGNPATDTGQPGGIANKDYLLLAGNSAVQSAVQIGAALAKGGPLTVKFDMYVTGTSGQTADATQWGAISLRPAGDAFPVAPANAFGMLLRRNGGAQAFQNGAGIGAFNGASDTPGFFSSPHFELTFTDTAKTGSAFAGAGSTVLIVNGTNPAIELPLDQQLSATGLVFGFRNFDNQLVGIDNLVIDGVASLAGDANNDGFVNIADFNLISDNFLTTPAIAGTNGDLNQDGVVDQKDFRAWRVATGAGGSGAGAGSSSGVPEPGTMMLAGIVALAACMFSGRQRN